MSIFLIISMYGIWSSIFPLCKKTLESSPPIFLTGIRMLFAATILLGYLFLKDRRSLKIGKSQILPLLVLSVFSIYLTNILECWGLQHLTATKGCFIYSLSPFFAAVFSYIHFGEKMNKKKLIGMLIGFGGFVPVFMMETGDENLFRAFSFFSWPELAIMCAALFSVYGWVLLRIMVKKQTLSPTYANGYSMLLGGTVACIHSLFVDLWNPTPVAAEQIAPFTRGIVLMTLVSNILCYNLYGHMLKKYTATFLSFMGLLSTPFASLSSWIILKESLSWQILLSTSIVSFGLFIVYQAELKQGYIAVKDKKGAGRKEVAARV
ncbi:MAG: DMT family transporter [Chlamydiota bacterium]